MKYLILLAFLFGCEIPQTEHPKYPGSSGSGFDKNQECWSQWRLGYIKTKEEAATCERNLSKYQFKIGEKVKLKNGYDDGCYGIILTGPRASIHLTVYYVVDIYCQGRKMENSLGFEELETELEHTK